ncbi:hypothetical protein N7462_005715 [Penicillium macrosclerotiorum]|uniref:uncharacterized protein n=1 Tax=Penicillium macrosclerotiorum TaxID=303699 RepID=UPI002546BC6C|nr:uncharacterized protein N7462_005715 [Penicillium macrosclerotiorum]KAJ5682550.1 hypothetical protein N7462_005715 [Penicillium macrosclerotiorum]
MDSPTIHTALFPSTELRSQLRLSDLTRMIDGSYLVSYINKIEFSNNKIRVRASSEFSEELERTSFTVVAFNTSGPDEKLDVIGAASMKQ